METEILTPEMIKQKMEKISEIDEKIAELTSAKKQLEAECQSYAKDAIEKAGVNEIRDPLFTITKTTTSKEEILLPNIVANLESFNILMKYIQTGNKVNITAAKTFKNFYAKEGQPLPFEEISKISISDKYKIELRPDVPVEAKLEI